MSKLLAALAPKLKTVAAAVVPLIVVSLTTGSFDWKSILAAGLTAGAVYLTPNRTVPVGSPKSAS